MAIPGDLHSYPECPRGDTDNDGGSMNTQCRDTRPGGQSGKRDALGDTEGDQECQSNGDGVKMDGI